MIMKNEEKYLSRCLRTVRKYVDEVVIADTGSTDNSIKIALQWGCKVVSVKWDDDFAAARNTSLDLATKDWLLILDPDEVVASRDMFEFYSYTRNFNIGAYRINTRNYTNSPRQFGFVRNPNDYEEGKGFLGYVSSGKTRFFYRKHDLHFYGCWHEMVDYDIRAKKVNVVDSPIPIHHYSGCFTPDGFDKKRVFYLRLAKKKLALNPKDPQTLWEVAVAENIAGHVQMAYIHLKKSCDILPTIPDRFFFLSSLANRLGQKEVGREYFERGSCLLFPNLTQISKITPRSIPGKLFRPR
jgi:glycosyltransferase involved in cell wall biosynthesis